MVNKRNKKEELDSESKLLKEERWEGLFALGGEASVQENAFGNNKEIYHSSNRNPATPVDCKGIRTIAQ